MIVSGVFMTARADDGMYPMSELPRLNLKEKGIELTAEQLFNPNQISLVDGICRVNGCTGSFVSANGLIITNHHCAFDAIQKASKATNPSSPTGEKTVDGENFSSVFFAGGFRKSLGIRLRCDVVTTSPLGGLRSVDSMLRHVYQTAISNKEWSATCILGAG
jgi:hypothetical protein